MIKISKRLASIASLVLDSGAKGVIDIGCDHALLDIYLYQNNNNLKIIASDINSGPLEKAKENVKKYNVEDKIKLVLCDGIISLEEKIDTIIISGMGTETIIDILNKGRDVIKKINRLIICSNNKYELLRKNIISLGFKINDEKIIFDEDKYYIAIEFERDISNYTEEEYKFGPVLLKEKSPLFLDYLKYNILKKEEIIKKIPESMKSKRNKIASDIEEYKKILN